MDRSRGRKLIKFLTTLALIGIVYVAYQYIVYYHDPAKILKDHAMTTGKLIRFDEPGPNGQKNLLYDALYVYEIDGKKYERPFVGATPCNYGPLDQLQEMLDYEYPVIYYRPNPEYSRLLITPKNFEKFDKEFPKELTSIYQKYWNCE